MNQNELIAQIKAAFVTVPRPDENCIVDHECKECSDLREGLFGYASAELPDSWFDWNWDQLPLLTDDAKQYYLPAFLCFAIRQPDSLVSQFVGYALDSDHRWQPSGGYSEAQKQAIRNYLAFQRQASSVDGVSVVGIEHVERRWYTRD